MRQEINRLRFVVVLSLLFPLIARAQHVASAPPAVGPVTRALVAFSRLRYEQLQYELLVLQQREADLQRQRGTSSIQNEEQLRAEESKPNSSSGAEAEIRSNMLRRQGKLFDELKSITTEKNEVEREMSILQQRMDGLEAQRQR